jgi:hypothetical protein
MGRGSGRESVRAVGAYAIQLTQTRERRGRPSESSGVGGVPHRGGDGRLNPGGARQSNAELVRGDLGEAVRLLKQESGKGLLVEGVTLPMALAELGLIDEYEFTVRWRCGTSPRALVHRGGRRYR